MSAQCEESERHGRSTVVLVLPGAHKTRYMVEETNHIRSWSLTHSPGGYLAPAALLRGTRRTPLPPVYIDACPSVLSMHPCMYHSAADAPQLLSDAALSFPLSLPTAALAAADEFFA